MSLPFSLKSTNIQTMFIVALLLEARLQPTNKQTMNNGYKTGHPV